MTKDNSIKTTPPKDGPELKTSNEEQGVRLTENLELVTLKHPGFGIKKYRPNLKGFNPDSMIFLNGDDRYRKEKTPEERVIEKMRFGLDSKVKTIFTGKIYGSRRLKLTLSGEKTPCALINCTAGEENYAGRTVLIPFDDFYIMQGTPNTKPPVEILDKEKLIGYMMGAEIDFCVTSIVEDKGEAVYVLGSRVMAAKEKFNRFWNGKIAGKDYLIKPGSTFEGRVVRTNTNGIIAEVFGIEFFCPNKELSWQILKDANELFKNGDVVQLKLQSMTRVMNTVKGYVSRKEAIENPMLKEVHEVNVGDIVRGKCTRVHFNDDKRKTVAFVNVEGRFDVYASMCDTISLLPEVRDEISVMILGKNEEQGTVWGEIRHVERGSR